jgi:SAM-dependent MidA family methyltransferase
VIRDVIRERGPVTVAAFMELALYDPRAGYYARSSQRSGRAGDFFTSVDVGAVFGVLMERQIAEMAARLGAAGRFDLVEAGAGNGRLSADILRAMQSRHPELYERIAVHLVEQSAAARSGQSQTLGDTASRIASSSDQLPERFEGVLIANELLDAMPVHQVVMREDGLREIYVAADGSGLRPVEGPLSTPALAAYLERLPVALEPGWVAEINLNAVAWMREATRRLERGFMILIDYGHEASELYSVTHSAGTLTTFSSHTMTGPGTASAVPAWLQEPGERDITAHVDFTSVRAAAEGAGLTTLGFLDQTYFLMGILGAVESSNAGGKWDLDLKSRLALKTLLWPGSLGSTMKVLILGKGVGTPPLMGCSYRVRVT